MIQSQVTYQEVLNFWFDPNNADKRFQKDPDFDRLIQEQFGQTWLAACQGLLSDWRKDVRGRLAEIIVLDQFSRNLMRGSHFSYSQDGMALILSQELLSQVEFKDLSQEEQHFAIMPFMHSESPDIHQEALDLFKKYGGEEGLKYEQAHKHIIDRFGRYPHRNQVMGRTSTPEELLFLMEDNSSF
ncbi:DUF924 family protein [Hutsoniella sourekii]